MEEELRVWVLLDRGMILHVGAADVQNHPPISNASFVIGHSSLVVPMTNDQ
jgi:hypothetical protein